MRPLDYTHYSSDILSRLGGDFDGRWGNPPGKPHTAFFQQPHRPELAKFPSIDVSISCIKTDTEYSILIALVMLAVEKMPNHQLIPHGQGEKAFGGASLHLQPA